MKIHELMTRDPIACSPATNLAAVAEVMFQQDCGIVPVVGEGDVVLGVVTDRDVAIALGTRHRLAADVRADEVMTSHVRCVREDEDVSVALEAMKAARVRRLPVLGLDGTLAGVLSINDLILAAAGGRPGVAHGDVISVLAAISEHRAPLGRLAPAASGR